MRFMVRRFITETGFAGEHEYFTSMLSGEGVADFQRRKYCADLYFDYQTNKKYKHCGLEAPKDRCYR
jgi:hypothetical protein